MSIAPVYIRVGLIFIMTSLALFPTWEGEGGVLMHDVVMTYCTVAASEQI